MIRALGKKKGQGRRSYDIRRGGDQTAFYRAPLVTGKLNIIGTDGKMGHLYAFERLTGAMRWKYRVDWRGLASDIVRSGDRIYAVTLGDELVCLDLESGAAMWAFRSGAPAKSLYWNSSPTVTGGLVYYGGLDGIAYAVHARSGKLVWKTDLGARVSTSVAAHGRDIYVGAANRHLYRLAADPGKGLGGFRVGGYSRLGFGAGLSWPTNSREFRPFAKGNMLVRESV